jgi:hypothetical protein
MGAILLGGIGCVAEHFSKQRLAGAAPWLVLLFFSGLALFGWMLNPDMLFVLRPLGLLGGLCAGIALLRTPWTWRVLEGLLTILKKTWVPWAGLLSAGAVLSLLLCWLPPPEDLSTEDLVRSLWQVVDDSDLQPAAAVQATTDRGRSITLYHARPAKVPPSKELFAMERRFLDTPALAYQVARSSPADLTYNCHGWTFIGGQYWVRGRDVPLILEDNGYQPVSEPRVGDLVVYRDSLGNISHTGVVRGFAAEDMILLESKWGWSGRFIHSPKAQLYGSSWTFYRTERPNLHRIRFLPDPPELVLPKQVG